jgi:ribosome-binding protein aMBF1 (putative translation factor)
MYKVALMDKDISTLLSEIKAATGWTEHRLAAELKTSQPTVNRILNGRTECMSRTYSAITNLHRMKCAGHIAEVPTVAIATIASP